MKARKQMITCLTILNNFDLRAEFTRLFGNDGADAVNRRFVVRGRFGFDEKFEQGFWIHIFLGGRVDLRDRRRSYQDHLFASKIEFKCWGWSRYEPTGTALLDHQSFLFHQEHDRANDRAIDGKNI